MNFKQTRLILFISLLLSFLASNSFAETGKSFLWEVKSDKTTIYLLGSVHIGKESLFPLKPVIEDDFKKSKILVLEIDISP